MPHTNCSEIFRYGKDRSLKAITYLCDTSYGMSFGFIDGSSLGKRIDAYLDSLNRRIFEVHYKKGIVTECYTYYYNGSSDVDTKEGFINGKPIRIEYEYKPNGMYKKIVTTTTVYKETKIYSDKNDKYGYPIISTTKTRIKKKSNKALLTQVSRNTGCTTKLN